MANMFTEISHRLESYEIFENEVYLSPKIHLDLDISRYLTNFAIACVLRYLDSDILAEIEDAWPVHHSTVIFPRGPDSVPHSHAGADLV